MEQSMFNERVYLQNDPYIINQFMQTKKEKEITYHTEKELYPELITMYDEFTYLVARLIKKIGYRSSIECSLIVSYLINYGFLSKDLSFTWERVDPNNDLKSRLGSGIVYGKGCCRHITGFHNDIFDHLELAFKKLYCYMGSNSFHNGANSQINHVMGLIEYQGNEYGIDIANHDRLYSFITPFILRELTLNNPSEVRYKPYQELLEGDVESVEEIQANLAHFSELVKERTLQPADYQTNYRHQVYRRLRNQDKFLYAFHKETQDLKREIANRVDSIYRK